MAEIRRCEPSAPLARKLQCVGVVMTALRGAEDRRAAERVALDMQITVHYTQGDLRWTETDATMVDLSASGMFIRCDRMPRAGQHVLVGLMHHVHGLCAAWGRTIRFDDWGGFGVHFTRSNAPLDVLIERLGATASGKRDDLLGRAVDARVWIDANDPF